MIKYSTFSLRECSLLPSPIGAPNPLGEWFCSSLAEIGANPGVDIYGNYAASLIKLINKFRILLFAYVSDNTLFVNKIDKSNKLYCNGKFPSYVSDVQVFNTKHKYVETSVEVVEDVNSVLSPIYKSRQASISNFGVISRVIPTPFFSSSQGMIKSNVLKSRLPAFLVFEVFKSIISILDDLSLFGVLSTEKQDTLKQNIQAAFRKINPAFSFCLQTHEVYKPHKPAIFIKYPDFSSSSSLVNIIFAAAKNSKVNVKIEYDKHIMFTPSISDTACISISFPIINDGLGVFSMPTSYINIYLKLVIDIIVACYSVKSLIPRGV